MGETDSIYFAFTFYTGSFETSMGLTFAYSISKQMKKECKQWVDENIFCGQEFSLWKKISFNAYVVSCS